MVRIDRPPPRRPVQPVVHALAEGERLLGIYSPGPWNNTALTFRRHGGPLLRFDHHSDPWQNPDDQSRGIHSSWWLWINSQSMKSTRGWSEGCRAAAASSQRLKQPIQRRIEILRQLDLAAPDRSAQ